MCNLKYILNFIVIYKANVDLWFTLIYTTVYEIYRNVGPLIFSLGSDFPKFPEWTHNLENLFWDAVWSLIMGYWRNLVRQYYFSSINFLHPIQGSIKQQKTFTTIAAANVEDIANYRGYYEWF